MTKKISTKTRGKPYGRLGLNITERKKYQLNSKELAEETAELVKWSIHEGNTKLPSRGAVKVLHKLWLDTSPWSLAREDRLKEVKQSISWLSKAAKEVQQGLETDLVIMLQDAPSRFSGLSKWQMMELITLAYCFQVHDKLKEHVDVLVGGMKEDPKLKEFCARISPDSMYLN